MPRTDTEILDRLDEIEVDLFGVHRADLICALSRQAAEPFLSPEGRAKDETEWDAFRVHSREKVVAAMVEYLPFALDKAGDHRGLSASRSIDHFRSWVWLLGDDEFDRIDWDNFDLYGVPILKQIVVDLLELPWIVPVSVDRMSEGRRCSDDCDEGCP